MIYFGMKWFQQNSLEFILFIFFVVTAFVNNVNDLETAEQRGYGRLYYRRRG